MIYSKKAKDSQSGFTLIETLIYIAIIGGVVVTFVTFSLSVSDSRNKTYVIQEVQANARIALNLISKKIQAASSVATTSSVFNIDPGFLTLTMASSTLNPTTIGLNQDDGILGIKQGSQATTTVTSDEVKITNLVFSDLTGASTRVNIRVELTIEYNNDDSDVEYEYSQSLQTAVSLRQ